MFKVANRGLHECKGLLSQMERDRLLNIVSELEMDGKLTEEEESFEDHPPFAYLPDHIKYLLLVALDPERSNFCKVFPKLGDLSRCVVLKYEHCEKHAMQIHTDKPNQNGSGPILSLVYTILVDCKRVSVELSNRNDGQIHNTMDSYYYETQDNSAYVFFGSEVTHGVKYPKSGTRFAFTFFFCTTYSVFEAGATWAVVSRGGILCPHCFRESGNQKLLRQHIKAFHADKWVPAAKSKRRFLFVSTCNGI